MKLPLICPDCAMNPVNIGRNMFTSVEVRDENQYALTCHKGHQNVVILQQQKFEILFELGAHAIEDGYYREAVSSFTASLERFYEFFLRAAAIQNNVDSAVFQESWRHLKNQSERQLGAYVATYTGIMRKAPTLLDSNRVRFRNNVTHKGYIQTRAEAVDYGQAVLDVLRPAMREMQAAMADGVQGAVVEHVSTSAAALPDAPKFATHGHMTVVCMASVPPADRPEKSLEEALVAVRAWRTMAQ